MHLTDEQCDVIDDAIEKALMQHEPVDNDARCSCGALNNMDGDVLVLADVRQKRTFMDTTTVYEPERPHECHPYPAASEVAQGTIQRCDVCGQFWESRREMFMDGFGAHPAYWGRVRWWHFGAKRRIRARMSAQRSFR